MYVWTILFFLSFEAKLINSFLMYPPQATSLSLVSSVSVPVTEYFPERRILIDWCFTMGYNLPSSPSQFYSIPIWPGSSGTKNKRDLNDYVQSYSIENQHSLYDKYENKTLRNKRHATDFTAGELYERIEDFLVNYGFHETCLLRTVCELARHPFDDQHQNIVTDILTFFLTPSMHESFDESEQLYREVYENAESRGFFGENCALLYPDCRKDLLTIITKVMFQNE